MNTRVIYGSGKTMNEAVALAESRYRNFKAILNQKGKQIQEIETVWHYNPLDAIYSRCRLTFRFNLVK